MYLHSWLEVVYLVYMKYYCIHILNIASEVKIYRFVTKLEDGSPHFICKHSIYPGGGGGGGRGAFGFLQYSSLHRGHYCVVGKMATLERLPL